MSRPKRRTPGRAATTPPTQAATAGNYSHAAPSWSGRDAGLYPVSEDTNYRGWRPALDRDTRHLITRYMHRAMISVARYIYTGVGQVGGAVHEKANFVVGSAWIPQYTGT